jgi:hypothetical protein
LRRPTRKEAAGFERDGDIVFHEAALTLSLLFEAGRHLRPAVAIRLLSQRSNMGLHDHCSAVSPPNLQAALKAGPVHFRYLVTRGLPLTSSTLKGRLKRGAKTAWVA